MEKVNRSATPVISESYILGFDMGLGDDAVLSVIKQEGNKFYVEKVIVGREAEELYVKLTNKSLERGKENEQITNVASCRI